MADDRELDSDSTVRIKLSQDQEISNEITPDDFERTISMKLSQNAPPQSDEMGRTLQMPAANFEKTAPSFSVLEDEEELLIEDEGDMINFSDLSMFEEAAPEPPKPEPKPEPAPKAVAQAARAAASAPAAAKPTTPPPPSGGQQSAASTPATAPSVPKAAVPESSAKDAGKAEPDFDRLSETTLTLKTDEKKGDGKPSAFATFLAFVALMVSGLALWTGLNNGAGLQELESRVAKLEMAAANAKKRASGSTIKSLDERIGKIETHLGLAEPTPAAKAKPQPAKKPAKKRTAAPKPAAKQTSGLSGPSGSGAWIANLYSFQSEAKAESELARIKGLGIDGAEIFEAMSGGKLWYRIRVTGFASANAAKAYGDKVKEIDPTSDPWVGR